MTNNLQKKLFHSYDLIGESSSILKLKEQINKLTLTESIPDQYSRTYKNSHVNLTYQHPTKSKGALSL